MRENTTHNVEGSMLCVTYEPDAYCQKPVYLHAPGQPYYRGEKIGLLGSMVGHGVYATVGKVTGGYHSTVAKEDEIAWFTGHMSKREAVEQMVGLHLGQPVDHPAAKVHGYKDEPEDSRRLAAGDESAVNYFVNNAL